MEVVVTVEVFELFRVGIGCTHCVLYRLAHLNADDHDDDDVDDHADDFDDDDGNSDDEENAGAYSFCVMVRSRRLTQITSHAFATLHMHSQRSLPTFFFHVLR